MSTPGKSHIGRYRLVKLLRSGHNCRVYEAIDATDHRRYAIKALTQKQQQEDPEAVAALRHEHEVAKDFDHPNLIHVYQYAMDHELPYLVLELFHGLNLKQEMRMHSELMRYLTSKIITGAAAGLNYLHQQGWIHRDVKPDNFLVDHQGDVKLIDFAIAERVRRGLARLFSGRSKIQGTLSYMSPEQIRGERLDFQSDVYSFGCLVYELAAGKVPFTGTSSDELLTKHLRAPVPQLIAANNAVTPEFSRLVASMMAKTPAERPAGMGGFIDAYENLRVFRVRPKPPADDASSEQ